MVSILPGFSENSEDYFGDETQVIIYAVERYILIGLYSLLLVLLFVNVWCILIKQRRYRNLPFLAFYVFSFLAISTRLAYILIQWSLTAKQSVLINDYYLISKLCVGFIQAWTTLEMTMRIR